ncbi:uncharacterized protein LOC119459510 isoform X4 [Dermacentor silvarum]|nr:uncharacterized protein LOC119459510 isoform X4 [Dermacentor silvarum]
MKTSLVVFSNIAVVAFILSTTSANPCPRPTCSHNEQLNCRGQHDFCNCRCSEPAPQPLPCTFGTGITDETEPADTEFPGMVSCPKISCACGEKATCLNKGSSCACTCVKQDEDCSYPWRITCVTSCRFSHRCLCTCAGPLPYAQPAPAQPCCPNGAPVASSAPSPPCCQPIAGRR